VKTVLFVCTANICRSPMAGVIFNALAEDGALPFRAQSAGTAALEGRAMDPNAVAALEEAGIYPGPHAARQVVEAMLEGSELVLAMTPKHAATVRRLGKDPPGGVYTLTGYASGVVAGGPRLLRAHHGRLPEHLAPALRARRAHSRAPRGVGLGRA
jgi:protein-tyrosine phosphatase